MSGRLLYTNDLKISKDDFLSALALMEHGGPDVPLCYTEYGTSKLGHNRLSILDADPRSNQPFISADGRYAIVYSGEVYNYKDLAREHDIIMRTNSDTEVVLELSIKIGFGSALKHFNGMFAYVIYEIKSGDYFAARDRLGIKPLYIYDNGDDIILSSEINAIVQLLGGKVDIDHIGKRQYKRLRGFYNGSTIYKDIKMLPAGHCIKDGKTSQWWKLPFGEKEPPSDEELRSLIDNAISCRMIVDVPIGALVSGGLDSTIIAAIAAKKYNNELCTWTAGIHGDEEFNELLYGRIAAKTIGSCHHEVTVYKERFLQTAKEIIKIRKEPLSFTSDIIQYELSREIGKSTKVVLCGEGSDELFFGYDRICKWAESRGSFDIRDFSLAYTHGAADDDIEIVESVMKPFYEYKRPIDIVSAFLQTSKFEVICRRLDFSSMLCGIETRSPFMDHRLVERLFAVPLDWKMKDGVLKAPLKRIYRDVVPEKIIKRQKTGMSEPAPLEGILGVSKDKAFDAWIEFNLSQLAL